MSIESEIRNYELRVLLEELEIKGFVTVNIKTLYRLLGKRNRAAGTWNTLLQFAIAEGEFEQNSIHVAELPGETILLTTEKLVPLAGWAT